MHIDGLSAKTVTYRNDLNGRAAGVTYPDSSSIYYRYDGAGRVTQVTDDAGHPHAAYTYTDDGKIDTHIIGDNLVTGDYAYNLRDRITEIDYTDKFRATYAYDGVGNIDTTVYRHGTGSDVIAVFYDDLHRLTDFDLSTGEDQTYTYDRSGNFKTMVTDASTLTYNYSAGATPNRLDSTTGTGGASYTYDDNGRVSTYAGNTLTYDYRGLTVTFNDGSNDHTYLIDPDGKRVKKVSGGATTYYIRGADGSVLAEYDGTGSLTSTYIYTGTQRLATIADDTTQYYIQDHLGNTRALMADNGTVVSTMDYWPYGTMLSQTGSGDTRFKYTGHERDDESALDYMLARMYESDTGRFLQMDPLADKYPGISPYVYTAGNPLKFVDPDGKQISGQERRFWNNVGGLAQTAINMISNSINQLSHAAGLQDEVQTAQPVEVSQAIADMKITAAAPPPAFISPLQGDPQIVTSEFGVPRPTESNPARTHAGIDLFGREGQPIIASENGVVLFSGTQNGYGKMVDITHGNGITTRSAHASSLLVSTGDTVQQGQGVGFVGRTGKATGFHLHFEFIRDGEQVDPRDEVQDLQDLPEKE